MQKHGGKNVLYFQTKFQLWREELRHGSFACSKRPMLKKTQLNGQHETFGLLVVFHFIYKGISEGIKNFTGTTTLSKLIVWLGESGCILEANEKDSHL